MNKNSEIFEIMSQSWSFCKKNAVFRHVCLRNNSLNENQKFWFYQVWARKRHCSTKTRFRKIIILLEKLRPADQKCCPNRRVLFIWASAFCDEDFICDFENNQCAVFNFEKKLKNFNISAEIARRWTHDARVFFIRNKIVDKYAQNLIWKNGNECARKLR